MVVIRQFDKIAVPEEALIQLFFSGRQRRRSGAGIQFGQGVLIVVVIDSQIAFYRKINDGRRHHLVVVVHLPNVAERCG